MATCGGTAGCSSSAATDSQARRARWDCWCWPTMAWLSSRHERKARPPRPLARELPRQRASRRTPRPLARALPHQRVGRRPPRPLARELPHQRASSRLPFPLYKIIRSGLVGTKRHGLFTAGRSRCRQSDLSCSRRKVMRYSQLIWNHQCPDDPVQIFSDHDEDGWERRKFEIFPDGSAACSESRVLQGFLEHGNMLSGGRCHKTVCSTEQDHRPHL